MARTSTGPDDFIRVSPTQAEIDECIAKKGRVPGSVYRVECRNCGKRMWGSGLGIGSHRKSCAGGYWQPNCEAVRAAAAAAREQRAAEQRAINAQREAEFLARCEAEKRAAAERAAEREARLAATATERAELTDKIVEARIAVENANQLARKAELYLSDLQRLLHNLNFGV